MIINDVLTKKDIILIWIKILLLFNITYFAKMNQSNRKQDVVRVNKGSILTEGILFSIINNDGIKAIKNWQDMLLLNVVTLKRRRGWLGKRGNYQIINNDEDLNNDGDGQSNGIDNDIDTTLQDPQETNSDAR